MKSHLLLLDEPTHRYTYDGVQVPSVTQILSPLSGLHVVDPEVLLAASDFGRAVHRACELDDLKQLNEEMLDPALAPYLAAWRGFSRDHRVSWSIIEGRVYNDVMRYAGTVDRYGIVDGAPAVVDLKSGAMLYPTVGAQLAAYSRAIPDAPSSTRRIGVLLRPDGRYKAKTYTSAMDWPLFASLITLRSFCTAHAITPNFKEQTHD